MKMKRIYVTYYEFVVDKIYTLSILYRRTNDDVKSNEVIKQDNHFLLSNFCLDLWDASDLMMIFTAWLAS